MQNNAAKITTCRSFGWFGADAICCELASGQRYGTVT
jgi:hypothetical protein